jgi:hypothetical protein
MYMTIHMYIVLGCYMYIVCKVSSLMCFCSTLLRLVNNNNLFCIHSLWHVYVKSVVCNVFEKQLSL